MRLSIIVSVLILITFTASPLFAQSDPIKWGEIPPEHLEMTDYPDDPDADAVILADYGTAEVYVDYHRGETNLYFKRHIRIKILSEAAYDIWGSNVIYYYAKDRVQKVKDVEGQTFVQLPNGEVKKYEMDDDAIFTEEVNDEHKAVRFTLPALEPGCVIEYRYRLHSTHPQYLNDWTFQHSEPTLYSEYRASIPPMLEYNSIIEKHGLDYEYETSPIHLGEFRGSTHRFIMRDIPAVRDEPFMTTPDDYTAKIRFQLSKFYYLDGSSTDVLPKWSEYVEDIMDNRYFGDEIQRHKSIRKQTEAMVEEWIKAGDTDDHTHMMRLHEHVRKTLTWNDDATLYVDDKLDNVYERGTGNSAEINLILLSMLRDAGLEAHPVILSTRDNGRLIKEYPLQTQFNYVVAYCTTEQGTFLLDATSPNRPYFLLPFRALNGEGLMLMDEGRHQWVPLQSRQTDKHQTTIVAEIVDEELKCHLEGTDVSYSALRRRNLLDEMTEDEYIQKHVLDEMVAVEIDSFQIENVDDATQPFKVNVHFRVPLTVPPDSGLVYFNPQLVDQYDSNPFQSPERHFPIDFGHPIDVMYQFKLKLPDDYQVKGLPDDMLKALPNQGGFFNRKFQQADGTLQMESHLLIRETVYPAETYPSLQDLFDGLIGAHQDQMVLSYQPN